MDEGLIARVMEKCRGAGAVDVENPWLGKQGEMIEQSTI